MPPGKITFPEEGEERLEAPQCQWHRAYLLACWRARHAGAPPWGLSPAVLCWDSHHGRLVLSLLLPSFSSQRQGRGSASSSPGLACGLGQGMELPSAGLCPGHHAVAYSYQSTCTGLQWPPPAPSAESFGGLGLWFPSRGITPVKPDTVPKEGS